MPDRTKDICEIKLRRKNGSQYLFLQIDEEMENLFKTRHTKTSEKYTDSDGEGLEFYELEDKLAKFAEKYNRVTPVGAYITLSEYGKKLIIENEEYSRRFMNLSLLRTVDASEGIEVEIEGMVLDSDIVKWAEALTDFVKFTYRNFVDGEFARAKISIEY